MTGLHRSHGLPALSRVLSDVCLGTRPRYSLVADEDFKKPNKQIKPHKAAEKKGRKLTELDTKVAEEDLAAKNLSTLQTVRKSNIIHYAWTKGEEIFALGLKQCHNVHKLSEAETA